MINDNILENCANAFIGETFIYPTHMLISTSTANVTASMTVIDGEIGTRGTLNFDTNDNVATYNYLRSGSSVLASTGDDLGTLGLMSDSTGGEVMTALNVSGILQTTNFDVDIDWDVRWNRI